MATTLAHAQTTINANEALALAAKNRPALRAAKLSVEQAKSASRALGAYAATTLSLGASTRSEVGATDNDFYLDQPFDLFGRTSAAKKVGQANVQLALAEYVATATELQNEVLTAYAEAVASKRLQEVAEELLKVSNGLFVATKRRFDEGKVAEIQLTRASIEFERAKRSSELRTAALNSSLKKLSTLVGAEVSVESDSFIPSPTSLETSSRSDLIKLTSQVQIAEAETGTAKLSNKPELSFQLRRSPWNNSPSSFGARVQLTWSLFDHGKAANETDSARKRAEAARKLLEDAKSRAKAELAIALIDIEANQKQVASYEVILVSARDLVAKAQTGYSEGFGTQMDVLEATRSLREIEQELIVAKQTLSLAIIAQYRASGYLADVLK